MIDVRLIDADALMETINRHCYPVQHDMTSIEPGMTRIGILQAIQEQPTVEPERKTGKWIGYNTEQDGWKRTDGSPVFMSCSECNGLVLNNGSAHWNFCPNCGTDMRGEQNETD